MRILTAVLAALVVLSTAAASEPSIQRVYIADVATGKNVASIVPGADRSYRIENLPARVKFRILRESQWARIHYTVTDHNGVSISKIKIGGTFDVQTPPNGDIAFAPAPGEFLIEAYGTDDAGGQGNLQTQRIIFETVAPPPPTLEKRIQQLEDALNELTPPVDDHDIMLPDHERRLQNLEQSQVEPPASVAIWVDDDGADCPAGATCHRTISAGLSAAAAGDVIGVLPGTYAPFRISADNVRLVAMRDSISEVNSGADPYNTDWPVKVVGDGYNGDDTCVRVANGRDDVLVRGFEVRDCFRGMHASMSGTATNFVDPGERITFAGNHIYCIAEDGIKLNQVSDVTVIGNWIEYVSWPKGDCNGDGVQDGIPHGWEHAIDCVACANFHYVGNRYGHTTYIMAKGGSISGEVRGNICEGPVSLKCFMTETVGHTNWTYRSSDQEPRYEVKGLVIADNDFAACAANSCGGSSNDVQIKHGIDISFTGNLYAKNGGSGNIAFSDATDGNTTNVCVETGVLSSHPAVTFSDTCPTDWPVAQRRDGTPKGFDFFY